MVLEYLAIMMYCIPDAFGHILVACPFNSRLWITHWNQWCCCWVGWPPRIRVRSASQHSFAASEYLASVCVIVHHGRRRARGLTFNACTWKSEPCRAWEKGFDQGWTWLRFRKKYRNGWTVWVGPSRFFCLLITRWVMLVKRERERILFNAGQARGDVCQNVCRR